MNNKEMSRWLIDAAKHSETNYQIKEKVVSIIENNGKLFVKVQWTGLSDSIDHTLEPFTNNMEDVLDMIIEYIRNLKSSDPLKSKLMSMTSMQSHGAM